MATTVKLSDGRVCVIRAKEDTADTLIAAAREHADQRKSESGEVYYLVWTSLAPFDPEKVCYNSESTGIRLIFLEEDNLEPV